VLGYNSNKDTIAKVVEWKVSPINSDRARGISIGIEDSTAPSFAYL
jgi:hypothetical protein